MVKQINSLYRYSVTGTPSVPVKDWHGWAGGTLTKETTLHHEGSRKEIVEGKATFEDITLTTGYDPDRDENWLDAVERAFQTGPVVHTLTRQAITPQGALRGKPRVDEGCVLKSVKRPDGTDGADATVGMIELVYAQKGLK